MDDPACLRIGDDATKIARSCVTDTSTKDNSVCLLLLKYLHHLVDWEGAANVGIEHKETVGFTLENCIPEVVESACGTQCLIFAQVFDVELWELDA